MIGGPAHAKFISVSADLMEVRVVDIVQRLKFFNRFLLLKLAWDK